MKTQQETTEKSNVKPSKRKQDTAGKTPSGSPVTNEAEGLSATSGLVSHLLSSSPCDILVVDADMKVVTANDLLLKKFKLNETVESVKGKDGALVLQLIKLLFNEPEEFVLRASRIISDRQHIIDSQQNLRNGMICSCDYIPILSGDTFEGYIIKFTDITRTKTISETFDIQRKFYEQILNNIPADVAVYSADGRFLFVNPGSVHQPDLRKWMIGKTQEEYNRFTGKDFEITEPRRKIFDEAVSSRTKQEWEEKSVTDEGEEVYYLRILHPVLDDRNEVGIVIGYGVNITERKKIENQIQESEEKYRRIIETMNLGMIEIDNEERIVYANQRFCNMSGYSFSELQGKQATELFLRGASLKRTRASLHTGEYGIESSYEMAVSTKTGNNRWWLTSATPSLNEDGSPRGAISVHLDITEQKKLEEQLRVAKQDSERASHSKDMFLANMSHEIRTPLNAIMGLGKLLNKSELDGTQKNYLNGIVSASTNLLSIINDLLDISKIEAGKITIENISFNLETVLQQTVSVLEHSVEEKGLSIGLELDKRISPVLTGDPFRLNQVFTNLISNAIKFTEAGGITVKASLEGEADGFQKVLVIIQDTGVGIKEEYLKTIFDKFTQEDETVVRKFGGTGLGMSITKQLMELMDGAINIHSQKNEGTTVYLNFNFRVGNARVFEKKRTIKNDTYNIKGRRILLVEDNSLNRLLACTILADYGAEVKEAENGLKAVEIMRRELFDIVLMDIQMPVMDGIRATNIIRGEINTKIPIIALTANAIKTHEHRYYEAGMNDVIYKPYNETNLVNPIAKWIGKSDLPPAPQDTETTQPATQSAEARPTPAKKEMAFDLGKLLGIGKSDPEFINRMLRLFISETPPQVAKLREAWDQKDLDGLRFYAHRMKPSISNLGIVDLKDVILKIELSKEIEPGIGPMVEQVEYVMGTVVEQMKETLEARTT